MRLAVVAAALMAALTPLHALAAKRLPEADPNASYSYRILNRPTSSDERAIKNLGLQPEAQRRSDRLFSALVSLLGGDAPKLNFVPTGSPLAPRGTSANLVDRPGAPIGQINLAPIAVEALINDRSPDHNLGVNVMPHEMAHTRQVRDVLRSDELAEGGAQSFSDMVTPEAARRAHIPYRAGNYDGLYAAYVQSVQKNKGRDWILAGQFGRPGSPAWP
jgi:hypothetical protein